MRDKRSYLFTNVTLQIKQGKEAECNPSADSLIHPEIELTHTAFPFALYPSASEPIACERALHLGESREVTREQHAKGDASARSRVLSL